jgi:hypothetical protein
VPDSDDISIAVMGEVAECHLTYIDISIVGDHPSRAELAQMVQEELDIAILIGDDEVFDSIMIHISMPKIGNPRSSRTSQYRANTPIYTVYLRPCSTMIDMSHWIAEIDERIGMEPFGGFSDSITSSIGEEHRVVAGPSDSWGFRK